MHCISLPLQPCRAGQANQQHQQEDMVSQGTRLLKGCVRGRSSSKGDDFVLLCGVREPPILTAPCREPWPSELKQLLIGFSKCAQYALSRQSSDNDRIVQDSDWGGASSCSGRVRQHRQHMVRQSFPRLSHRYVMAPPCCCGAGPHTTSRRQHDLKSQRPRWPLLPCPCECWALPPQARS